MRCDELPLTPIPNSLCCWEGRREKTGINPGKEGAVGGRCFQYWFYFSLSSSLAVTQSISPSPVWFSCDNDGGGISPWPYLNSRAFSLLCSAKGGNDREVWWVPGIQTGKTDNTTPLTAIHWLLKVSDWILNAWNTRQKDALKKRPVGISAQWTRNKQSQLKHLNCNCAGSQFRRVSMWRTNKASATKTVILKIQGSPICLTTHRHLQTFRGKRVISMFLKANIDIKKGALPQEQRFQSASVLEGSAR